MKNIIAEYKKIRKELRINILLGLISIYKYSKICFELRIFRLPVLRSLKYVQAGNSKEIIELFPAKNKDIEQDVLLTIVNQISNEKFKNIVFIRSGLGEVYLLNQYLEQYMEKNNLNYENTCFTGMQDTFGDLFKQYNPMAFYKKVIISWDYLLFAINKDFYSFGGRKIFVYINKDFIYKLMDEYKNSDTHVNYAGEIANLFQFDSRLLQPKVFTAYDTQKNAVLEELKRNKINKDNFIFISQNANSVYPLSEDFWNKLTENLKSKGYDILLNTNTFSITEAKIMASYSNGIIGLRSGFLESLVELNKPMHVIYTRFCINDMPADKFKKALSLMLYPNANKEKIFEYEVEDYSEEDILQEIIRRF